MIVIGEIFMSVQLNIDGDVIRLVSDVSLTAIEARSLSKQLMAISLELDKKLLPSEHTEFFDRNNASFECMGSFYSYCICKYKEGWVVEETDRHDDYNGDTCRYGKVWFYCKHGRITIEEFNKNPFSLDEMFATFDDAREYINKVRPCVSRKRVIDYVRP